MTAPAQPLAVAAGPVPLRALIVDDEPPARARLRKLLAGEPGVTVLGECASGPEAVAAIERHAPDLLLLDIQMPTMDGFAVLEALHGRRPPIIIFVTAHDRYAVRAFESHALDYLLKPFTRDRFHDALDRARERLRENGRGVLEARLAALLDAIRAENHRARPPGADRLAVKTDGRVLLLRTSDIDWVEAAANYVRLHVRGESHLLRRSMASMEQRLPAGTFLRIHRSTIVNLDRVREIQPWFRGDSVAILHDGTRLSVGRAFAERLHELMG